MGSWSDVLTVSDPRETVSRGRVAVADVGPRSAVDMVNECFRHQHPEAYGGEAVAEPVVPTELRYGRDEILVPPTGAIAEEQMGNPSAVPLSEAPYVRT
jgi:hypothetical protein